MFQTGNNSDELDVVETGMLLDDMSLAEITVIEKHPEKQNDEVG